MLKITLIAVGQKMPLWVEQGVSEYAKRLRDGLGFSLIEIPLQRRGKDTDMARILAKETSGVLQAIPTNAYLIALNSTGESFSSEELAKKLEHLQLGHSHLCFLIGGPEGLPPALLTQSNEQWSLSKLTLPHPLVRIVFVEALYRAWSILHNHPYHK